jgi:uncharacterized protein
MQIGVLSDTHGHLANTRQAVAELEARPVELVIHCGDIGAAEIVPLLDPWPTHFVFGNVDHNESELRNAIEAAQQTCHERFGSLELEGRRIAFLHGDDTLRLRETISSGQWDLVCHGHTHVAEHYRLGKTLVLNPGALYRANPHSLAVVSLPDLKVTEIPLPRV